jgi:hypothetical protein
LCASESTSEFERLATNYNTGRVKREFGAVHHSHRIRIQAHWGLLTVRDPMGTADGSFKVQLANSFTAVKLFFYTFEGEQSMALIDWNVVGEVSGFFLFLWRPWFLPDR